MENRELLLSYVPVARFIAQVCGGDCEVVLHDLTNMENSIIAIEHGHVTGRSTGGTITDFALRTVFDEAYRDKDFVANYSGKTEDGRTLKSSTFYIRNKAGETVGLLCTNVDITEKLRMERLLRAETQMQELGSRVQEAVPKEEAEEQFPLSMQSLVDTMFQKAAAENGCVDPKRMLAEEKRELVAELERQKLFMIRGTISKVAKKLAISEATLYRYLRELRGQDERPQEEKVQKEDKPRAAAL